MLDAVLLEWEGVLADTGAARRDVLLRALADEGVPWSAAAYDACCGGMDAHSAAMRALARTGRSDPTRAELVALRAIRGFAEWLSAGFSLMPGAAEFVEGAASRTRVAVVTQAGRMETDLALRLSMLDQGLSTVLTADDVMEAPPSPDLYERALSNLSRLRPMRAQRVVAIVQSPRAMRAARSAGVRTLAVGVPVHVAVEADGVVDDLRVLTVPAIVELLGIAREGRPA